MDFLTGDMICVNQAASGERGTESNSVLKGTVCFNARAVKPNVSFP